MSKLLSLNVQDWLKGLIVTVLSAVIALIIQGLTNGNLDWKTIGTTAAVAGLSYILKQLGTDDAGKFLGKI